MPGMPCKDVVGKQMSLDKHTGDGTQWVKWPKGWKSQVGHFTEDVEIFVLDGDIDIGGFKLHKYSYTFIPAGIAVGSWEAKTECSALFMPCGYTEYKTSKYVNTYQGPGGSTLHEDNLSHPRWGEYIPCIDTPSMNWESTTFLPAGSARKSLRGTIDGAATWILGVTPQWIEGNFLASHPTSEETYLLEGSIGGHWCMADDPWNRRFDVMEKDGYYWRPAHIPHGPFYSDTGCLMLFRTEAPLTCHWQIHDPDYTQQHDKKFNAAGQSTFHGEAVSVPTSRSRL